MRSSARATVRTGKRNRAAASSEASTRHTPKSRTVCCQSGAERRPAPEGQHRRSHPPRTGTRAQTIGALPGRSQRHRAVLVVADHQRPEEQSVLLELAGELGGVVPPEQGTGPRRGAEDAGDVLAAQPGFVGQPVPAVEVVGEGNGPGEQPGGNQHQGQELPGEGPGEVDVDHPRVSSGW